MVCLRNEPLPRSLFSAAFGLCPLQRGPRGDPRFFTLGVDNEREEVSQDALPELQCREAPLIAALFWCLAKIKLRARELI